MRWAGLCVCVRACISVCTYPPPSLPIKVRSGRPERGPVLKLAKVACRDMGLMVCFNFSMCSTAHKGKRNQLSAGVTAKTIRYRRSPNHKLFRLGIGEADPPQHLMRNQSLWGLGGVNKFSALNFGRPRTRNPYSLPLDQLRTVG